jgi:hypothetical protein
MCKYKPVKGSYPEIMAAMGEPKWWNEYGAPRYCDFSPQESANIYASEVVLSLIACQSCGHEFKVCFSQSETDIARSARTLGSYIKDCDLHYGDPPNSNCCMAGPTMNSIPIKVLEYWDRGKAYSDWERRPELEIDIMPDWAKETTV